VGGRARIDSGRNFLAEEVSHLSNSSTEERNLSIFDVWIQSWTMTDLMVFGTAGLVVVLIVFVRPILASRRSRDAGSENGTR
jgi:hypothetical protein